MSSNAKPKRKYWYTCQPSDEEHPSTCEAAGCVGTADTSSTEIQLFTHHDIVKQYRKGLTAVVDRCVVYISYNRYHGVFRKVLFVAVLFWPRLVHADLAMHATLAALGTLPRSMSL